MFLSFTILEIFAISQSDTSNSYNFLTKLGKIELLITFHGEMISTRSFQLFTSYLESQEVTPDLNILINYVIIQFGAP